MFISIWNYPFINDHLTCISTRVIPSADITEDLLTAYQKDKAGYIQYIQEILSQNKSNNFFVPLRRIYLKTFFL